jgi:hypothetical protein
VSQIPKNCSGIPLHDGKVGLNEPCCCNECNCETCECTLDVTIGGVTFPANGQMHVICVSDTGGNANNLWFPNLGGDAALALARVTLTCLPDCGVYYALVETQYLQIFKKADGSLPVLGAAWVYWTSLAPDVSWLSNLQSNIPARAFTFPSCNECGCPTGTPKFLNLVAEALDAPNKPCLAELRKQSWQVPTFTFDCGECP